MKAEPDYYIEHGNMVFTAAYHKKEVIVATAAAGIARIGTKLAITKRWMQDKHAVSFISFL